MHLLHTCGNRRYENFCNAMYTCESISTRYKQHQTEFEVIPSERPIALRCKVSGCRCSSYNYIPQPGGVMVRCKCKHLPQDHSEAAGHMCKKCESDIPTFKICSLQPRKCFLTYLKIIRYFSGKVCSGFHSPYTCGCGRPSFEHRTLVSGHGQQQLHLKEHFCQLIVTVFHV